MNMSTIIASVALLLGATGSADQPMKNPKQPPQREPLSQGLEIPEKRFPPGYNAPACTDTSGWNVDVWGSFTYWNVNQEHMSVAVVPLTPSPIAANVQNGIIVDVEDTWAPGFKCGIASNIHYDGWVGSAEYTWVRSSTSVSGSNADGQLPNGYLNTSLYMGPFLRMDEFVSKWKMHLDLLDLLFSRPCYEGTRLAVTPFAGLRALWIRQRQTLNFVRNVPLASYFALAKSHCWSIGPAAGISGHWLLGKGFRFEGSTAGSLLYTRYTTISAKTKAPNLLPNLGRVTNVNTLRPTAELGIGMGWSSYFCNQKYLIDFSARYDFKYFWAQNMGRWFTSSITAFQGNAIGALMVHGLTLSGGFDF